MNNLLQLNTPDVLSNRSEALPHAHRRGVRPVSDRPLLDWTSRGTIGASCGGVRDGPPNRAMENVIRIAEGQVWAWHADLDLPGETVAHHWAVLSAEERFRASRYHFERDRRRFVVARAVLRGLASRYTGVQPREIQLMYSEHGKPSLAHTGIEISVSHSGEHAAYAFARREVGIDIEVVRTLPDVDAIAAQHFSAAELADLRESAGAERLAAFYQYWTRKEAYVKARGEGLSIPFASFSVSLDRAPVLLVDAAREGVEQQLWTVADLQPRAPCIGAVAVRGSVDSLVEMRLES